MPHDTSALRRELPTPVTWLAERQRQIRAGAPDRMPGPDAVPLVADHAAIAPRRCKTAAGTASLRRARAGSPAPSRMNTWRSLDRVRAHVAALAAVRRRPGP